MQSLQMHVSNGDQDEVTNPAKKMMSKLPGITLSLLVFGDFYAAKLSARTQKNGDVNKIELV